MCRFAEDMSQQTHCMLARIPRDSTRSLCVLFTSCMLLCVGCVEKNRSPGFVRFQAFAIMIIGVSGCNFVLQKKVLMCVSNDWRFVICKLVADVGVEHSCLVGHLPVHIKRFHRSVYYVKFDFKERCRKVQLEELNFCDCTMPSAKFVRGQLTQYLLTAYCTSFQLREHLSNWGKFG